MSIRDDAGSAPASLATRLTELNADIAASAISRPAGGWETVGREEAAQRLVERGVDVATARRIVTDYLRETSERIGVPVYQWGLDQGDVEAMAADRHLPPALGAEVVDDPAHGDEDGDDDAAGWSR